MRFATLTINLFLLASKYVSASVEDEWDWDHTPHERGTCGTAPNANLADCEILLNNHEVFVGKKNWGEKIEYYPGGVKTDYPSKAKRVSCNGRCCVFFQWKGGISKTTYRDDQFWIEDPPDQNVRLDALQLLGCANRTLGLINGVGLFEMGNDFEHSVCISNIDGGDACFSGKGDST